MQGKGDRGGLIRPVSVTFALPETIDMAIQDRIRAQLPPDLAQGGLQGILQEILGNPLVYPLSSLRRNDFEFSRLLKPRQDNFLHDPFGLRLDTAESHNGAANNATHRIVHGFIRIELLDGENGDAMNLDRLILRIGFR